LTAALAQFEPSAIGVAEASLVRSYGGVFYDILLTLIKAFRLYYHHNVAKKKNRIDAHEVDAC